MTALTNVDRFAEDLQVWATAEFGFVELDDADSRTSVMMPQKKNPYALALLRGERATFGGWVGVLALKLTPTGQPDNRSSRTSMSPTHSTEPPAPWACSPSPRPRRGRRGADAAAASSGYMYATDMCDYLAIATGADNRTLHRVVGRAVNEPSRPEASPSPRLGAARRLGSRRGHRRFRRRRVEATGPDTPRPAPWYRWSGRRRHGRYARRPRRPPLPAPRRRRRESAPLVPRDLRRRDPTRAEGVDK